MPVYLHTVAVSAYPSQCRATAMSLPEWRLAADAAAYTYADFEQWYGAHARQMWEEAPKAAATEHSQTQWRGAVDGTAYTYADFEQWYGAHARRMWEEAPAAFTVFTKLCEHSLSTTGFQASSSGSEPRHPAGATVCAGALSRNATRALRVRFEYNMVSNRSWRPLLPHEHSWRPLLHHERFEYNMVSNRPDVMRGYVLEAEMILPDHMDCGCYLSKHSFKEKLFREVQADDASFPVHYSVSDQWAVEIARTGFDGRAMNGKWPHEFIVQGFMISYGYVLRR